METIDLAEYDQLKSSTKSVDPKVKYVQPFNRSKAVDLPPEERIMQRLKTYENPIMEPSFKYTDTDLLPIIDLKTAADFNKIHKILKSNLNDMSTLSR
jgi:hypothetical protein